MEVKQESTYTVHKKRRKKRNRWKKYIFIIAAVLLLCIACVTVSASVRAGRVKSQLEDRIFVTYEGWDFSCVEFYSFRGGRIAQEQWQLKTFEITGDITFFENKYKVDASLFSNRFNIKEKVSGRWQTAVIVCLDEDGAVQKYKFTKDTSAWHETTLEEIENDRIAKMCDHEFGAAVKIKETSCSEPGEEKMSCRKCGYEKIEYIAVLPHDYVNKYCSVCGEKVPLEKSDIEPNTWYVYDSVLHFQNCELVSVGGGDKAMMVYYKAVCQHCHVMDYLGNLAGVEVGYPVENIYRCDECEKRTLVSFKIG